MESKNETESSLLNGEPETDQPKSGIQVKHFVFGCLGLIIFCTGMGIISGNITFYGGGISRGAAIYAVKAGYISEASSIEINGQKYDFEKLFITFVDGDGFGYRIAFEVDQIDPN